MSKPKLGATGKFPYGKLNEQDEGELQFRVTSSKEHRLVHIEFGKPVAWFSMPPEMARGFAKLLIKHADNAEQGTQ